MMCTVVTFEEECVLVLTRKEHWRVDGTCETTVLYLKC